MLSLSEKIILGLGLVLMVVVIMVLGSIDHEKPENNSIIFKCVPVTEEK